MFVEGKVQELSIALLLCAKRSRYSTLCCSLPVQTAPGCTETALKSQVVARRMVFYTPDK